MKPTSNNNNIKAALTIATAALLGTSNTSEAQTANDDDWQFDTALLLYSEADRVSAGEAIINGQKTFEDDEILNLKLTIDTLTGSSANGAVAQPEVQTFTRPSGKGQYQINAGDTPLDNTFKDTRVQLNAQWTQLFVPDYTLSVGGHLSKEYDYLSLGINGNLAIDFDRKNSTFSLGFSYFHDIFTPEGGIPKPFSSMLIGDNSNDSWDELFSQTRLGSNDTKTTTDLLLGFTQVINRRMITQFNYSYSIVDGYLTDPFKIVSVVDDNGVRQDNIYESRPDSRVKQSLYAQTMYHFETNVLDFSYRYMWDDWDISSHTIDTRLRVPLGNIWGKESYIQPHIRYYQQSGAEFYRPFINEDSVNTLTHVSADYRIGEMTAYTIGAKFGTLIKGKNELSFRLEYYRQTPSDGGFKSIGVLNDLELYPRIEAVIGQVTYSF